MKKSVYLFMLILLIKSVSAYSDIQSFFTQNITNIDFILLTIIFTAIIKLTLKGKFGEDGLANILYLTLGVALSSASVFYGNLSIYTLGMWILDLNQYIVLGILIISVILLYKAIPPWGPFNYWILRAIASIFIVSFFSEKINPGFLGGILGQYTNLSSDFQIWITVGVVILLIWGLISLLKFLRGSFGGESASGSGGGSGFFGKIGRGLWSGTKWAGRNLGKITGEAIEAVSKDEIENIKEQFEDRREKVMADSKKSEDIIWEKYTSEKITDDEKENLIKELKGEVKKRLSKLEKEEDLTLSKKEEGLNEKKEALNKKIMDSNEEIKKLRDRNKKIISEEEKSENHSKIIKLRDYINELYGEYNKL